MKGLGSLKKVWNLVTTVIVALVVIVAVLLVGVRLFGLRVYTVLSPSMEPEYRVGSLIYVKSVDADDLTPGDDITFMLDEDTIATHRIHEVLPDDEDPTVLRFRTYGINNTDDEGNYQLDGGTPVHYKNIIGKPVFTIPYLGYVANYIQNPPGMYVAIAGAAVLLLLVFLPDLLFDDKKKKAKESAAEPSDDKSEKKDGETK